MLGEHYSPFYKLIYSKVSTITPLPSTSKQNKNESLSSKYFTRFTTTRASPLAKERRWAQKAPDSSLPPEPPREDRRHLLARLGSADEKTQDEIWQSLSWKHQGSLIVEAHMFCGSPAATQQRNCERLGIDLSFLLDILMQHGRHSLRLDTESNGRTEQQCRGAFMTRFGKRGTGQRNCAGSW
jgi:hypothetical protein